MFCQTFCRQDPAERYLPYKSVQYLALKRLSSPEPLMFFDQDCMILWVKNEFYLYFSVFVEYSEKYVNKWFSVIVHQD